MKLNSFKNQGNEKKIFFLNKLQQVLQFVKYTQIM